MLYSLLRPLLFQLDAEFAHDLALNLLKMGYALGFSGLWSHPCLTQPRRVMGLDFPKPVGLAAGLDKNGAYIEALATLGFGFIEVGTVTPRPQPGNPKPRLFRLPQAQAIINRMGFNNVGVERLIENVKQVHHRGILGINIGKNSDTPFKRAMDDYLLCLEKVYVHADYVSVNISSPNTQDLRNLQEPGALNALLEALKEKQIRLHAQYGKYVPLVLKIAPDLEKPDLTRMAELIKIHRLDAVIATNTSVKRSGIENLAAARQTGGLSGAPLRDMSTALIRQLSVLLERSVPIIGVGGILSGKDALAKIEAGASLVQVYTGLMYRGPELIGEICTTLG